LIRLVCGFDYYSVTAVVNLNLGKVLHVNKFHWNSTILYIVIETRGGQVIAVTVPPKSI